MSKDSSNEDCFEASVAIFGEGAFPEWQTLVWPVLHLYALTSNLVWLAVLLIWENNWDDHDSALFEVLPFQLHYMRFYTIVSAVCIVYLLAIFFWVLLNTYFAGTPLKDLEAQRGCACNSHKVGIMMCIFAPLAWFVVYQFMWGSEFGLLSRSNQTILPLIQPIFCVMSVPASYFAFHWVLQTKQSKVKTSLKVTFILLAFVCIFSFPWWYDSAHIIDGELPPRPQIIGHRGTPTERPENTLESFQNAMDLSVSIVESDLVISRDGIPFVMHDPLLDRTTNVGHVFPERRRDPVGTFSIEEITQLDAGGWFGEDWEGEKVPLLADAVKLIQGQDFKFFADVRPGPDDFPFRGQEEEIVLKLFEEYDFSDQVIWIVSDKSQVPELRRRFPKMLLASEEATLEEVESGFFDFLNHEWTLSNDEIRSFSPYNATIVYTVNTNWLFDQMWCLGANFVTTNHARRYLSAESPTWWMQRSNYYLMSAILESVCIAGIVLNFVLVGHTATRTTEFEMTTKEYQDMDVQSGHTRRGTQH
eukprot:TRINITY_DN5182_c4_g1_i7.p1 TRINITY_DN5182_c4_g1~~TRINITY_DN5182_c4_g1_i7.p1  ORF type:complete len:531 (+),score=63.67 TRINITY_DN5182_c4_g1_i7:3-1595(+)